MKIIAFGDICLHIAVQLPKDITSLPEFSIGNLDFSPGGSAPVLCTQVAALGHEAILIGSFGNDILSHQLRRELDQYNVNCRYTKNVNNTSVRSLIILSEEEKPRIVVDLPSEVEIEQAPFKHDLNGADYVYSPGFPGYENLLDRLKGGPYQLVSDFGFLPWLQNTTLLRENVLQRIQGINIALLSGSNFPDTFNQQMAIECIERGARIVITTLSERGAFLTTAEEHCYFSAIPCQALNTVGAGDSFLAGLLVAMGEGKPLHDAVRFAQAVAATKITQLSGPASRIDIERLISCM